MAASYFYQHKYMLGNKLESPKEGFMKYKVKVLEDIKLEDDPKKPCTDYKIRGEYARCVENEIIQQNLKYLNCTPPWMTENKDLWCKGMHKVDNLTSRNFSNFVDDINYGEASNGKCMVPCREKFYQIKDMGLMEDSHRKGFLIMFANKVSITKAYWTNDGVTLLSKIGGSIGISKNLLWLIILLISSVGVIMSRLKLNK